jgi:hypothetical protein
MNASAIPLAVLIGIGASAPARAADYSAVANEAVRADRDGRHAVQLPPGSNVKKLPPQPAPADGGIVYMIETEAGLAECTHRWYRDDECRPATLGKLRLMRAWIVKRGGRWWQCSLPSKDAKCLQYGQMFLWHTLM